MAKQWLYSLLLKDSVLTSTSTVFEVFSDSISGSNTGLLHSIFQALSDTTGNIDTSAISSTNLNLISQNVIELHYKTVIEIYNCMIGYGIQSLTPEQIGVLQSIAMLCPYTDGNAVYSARTILSLINTETYINECEASKQDNSTTEKSLKPTDIHTTKSKGLLPENELLEFFPNPATDILNISYSLQENCTIEIFNMLGVKIRTLVITNGSGKKLLSLNGFNQGVYYIKVTRENKLIKSGNIVVIK